MLKKNKINLIISCVIILLPVLFGVIMWNDLPDVMTTHWGADGKADGFSGKTFTVFVLPLIFLVLHLVALFLTSLDNKQNEQSKKALSILFWIFPVVSLLTSGIIYSVAFDKDFNFALFMPALLGLMFIFIGNYFPKTKQNRSLGIKLFWTLNNEENWNKTHRLSGKVWVIGGLALIFSIILPFTVMMWVTVSIIIAMIIIPLVYSYSIYREHKKQGIIYNTTQKNRFEKTTGKVSLIIILIILIGVTILMFTGNIEVSCEEESFNIDATYWADLKVNYSEIDTVEYRNDLNVGMRTNGFASAKLSLGIFLNNEFGSYTLYSYTKAQGYIVLTSGEKTLVIGMKDATEAQSIYNTIVEKIEK